MIKRLLIASAVLLCAPAMSIAQSSGMTPAAPPTAEYMMKAGQLDQFEIQEGQLAAQMGFNPRVKQFGEQMVHDHTQSTQMIMAAARKSGMATPSSPPPLSDMQQQALTKLETKSGKDFDETYISQQKMAHQGALDLHQSYGASGSDPNFRAAARMIVPVVKQHITMLQGMTSL